ncbi:MAG: peptide deformylase [Candidatus Aminicenantes bacterium]|nr:peptide deformylase [Candidatus Aminicenantes bacterium]
MAVLEIIKLGHPTLAKKAAPIQHIDEEIVEIAQNMIETMHAAPGLGLSAPQVDVSRRLITVDLSIGEKKEDLIVLINPELVHQEGRVVREEGCLSVPEVYEKIGRPQKIIIKGLDLAGKEKKIEAIDLLARVFCHEIDHLNGRLFIDGLSSLKRNLIKKRFKKKAESSKR